MSEKKSQDEEEIAFDFSKIISRFRKKRTSDERKTVKETDDEEEVSLDFEGVGNFFRKYGIVFLVLIPVFLSMFFRLYPVFLPITDDWAKNSVDNFLAGQVRNEINQQYPNLPDANKQALIQQRIEEIYATQGADLDNQIKQTSAYFKTRLQDDNGHTYLTGIDPWYWMHLTKNYLEDPKTGFGDAVNEQGHNIVSLRNGRMDYHTTNLVLNPGVMVVVYKILSVFDRDITVMRAVFFVPVILIALTIIPIFFIGREFSGNMGGIFAGIVFALNGALLSRSNAGFSDSDPYNVLFPAFIVWVFIIAMKQEDWRRSLAFGGLIGLLFGLFSIAWAGFGHMLTILLLVSVATLGYYVLVYRAKILKGEFGGFFNLKKVKICLTTLAAYLFSSFIFVSLFRDARTFFYNGFADVIGFITLKDVAIRSIWPNVLVTVAEFNEVPIQNIVSQMGGTLFFIIALAGLTVAFFMGRKEKDERIFTLSAISLSIAWYIGVVLILLKQSLDIVPLLLLIGVPFGAMFLYSAWKKKRDLNVHLAALMVIWFAVTLYSFTNGHRFAILLVPSFAIAFSIAISRMSSSLINVLNIEFGINRNVLWVTLVVALSALLFYSPLVNAHNIGKNQIPSINDAWFTSLSTINQASDDAIITSWWDFGHWFYAISERRVTFDGADQGRRIHWVGKSLLEDDEDLAVGILRMLNCGQEESFRVFSKNFNNLPNYSPTEPNTPQAIDLMYEVMRLHDKGAARQMLLDNGFTQEGADETLGYTHCDDLIDQYYIVSQDMIGKAGVWGHFGSWNFERAEMYQAVRPIRNAERGISVIINKFSVDDRNAASILYNEIQSNPAERWVTEWPSYYSGVSSCTRQDNLLNCQNGLQVDFETRNATLPTQAGWVQVNTLIYPEGDQLKKIVLDPSMPYSATLIPTGNGQFSSILSHPDLAASMFTRLFFMGGHGLTHFTLHHYERSFTNEDIFIYRVHWDKQDPIVMPELIPPLERAASHILVETREEAEEIIGLLDQGEDFALLAEERSFDGSAANGGYLGYFAKGRMVKEFEDAVFSMEIGSYSSTPVQTQFGYHVILVIDERGGKIETGRVDIEAIQQEIEKELMGELDAQFTIQ